MKTDTQLKLSPTAVGIAAASLALVSPSAAQESDIFDLDAFHVTGQPVEHYRAVDALTGNKTGALLADLPVSLSVVPRQLIEDRAVL